jgi:hypothetical protein
MLKNHEIFYDLIKKRRNAAFVAISIQSFLTKTLMFMEMASFFKEVFQNYSIFHRNLYTFGKKKNL